MKNFPPIFTFSHNCDFYVAFIIDAADIFHNQQDQIPLHGEIITGTIQFFEYPAQNSTGNVFSGSAYGKMRFMKDRAYIHPVAGTLKYSEIRFRIFADGKSIGGITTSIPCGGINIIQAIREIRDMARLAAAPLGRVRPFSDPFCKDFFTDSVRRHAIIPYMKSRSLQFACEFNLNQQG